MINRKCIVCDKEGRYPFCSTKCRKIALQDPDTYIKKIEEKQNQKQELMNKINEHKNELDDIKYERGEYILRKIVTKNKTGDAYGITLPKSVWKKYYRFNCKVKSNGIIILVPKNLKDLN